MSLTKMFSAYREISNTPRATVIMHVGHLNGDWRVYAQVEFVIQSGKVYRVRPSTGAVHGRLVDELLTCATAYYNDDVIEVSRYRQSSWGVAPDLVFYTVNE